MVNYDSGSSWLWHPKLVTLCWLTHSSEWGRATTYIQIFPGITSEPGLRGTSLFISNLHPLYLAFNFLLKWWARWRLKNRKKKRNSSKYRYLSRATFASRDAWLPLLRPGAMFVCFSAGSPSSRRRRREVGRLPVASPGTPLQIPRRLRLPIQGGLPGSNCPCSNHLTKMKCEIGRNQRDVFCRISYATSKYMVVLLMLGFGKVASS